MTDAARTPAASWTAPLFRLYDRLPRLHVGRRDIPSTLVGAYWAAMAAGVVGIVLGVVARGHLDWYREQSAKAVAQSIKDGDDPVLKMPTDADIRGFIDAQLIGLVIAAVLLVLLSWMIANGRPSSRWYLAGLWFVATAGFLQLLPGMAFLGVPTAIAMIATDAPLLMCVLSMAAALLMLIAFISVMVRPSREFFAAEKAAMLDRATERFKARQSARGGGRRARAAAASDEYFGDDDVIEPRVRTPRPGTEGTPKRRDVRRAVQGEQGEGGAVSLSKESEASASATAPVRPARPAPKSKSRSSGA